jgi:hypothetical protein
MMEKKFYTLCYRELGSFSLSHAGFVEVFPKDEQTTDPADKVNIS